MSINIKYNKDTILGLDLRSHRIEAIITYHGDYEAIIRVCLRYMR